MTDRLQKDLAATKQQVRDLTNKIKEFTEKIDELVKENTTLKKGHQHDMDMIRRMTLEKVPESVLQVDRRMSHGEVGMVTHGQVNTIMPGESYTLLKDNITKEGPEGCHWLELAESSVPPYIAMPNGWQTKAAHGGDEAANVLGGSNVFFTNTDDVTIPHGHDTEAEFAYYGCHLVKIGTRMQFDTPQAVPVTHMTVGERYVENYLLQDNKGGGFYTEYHSCPHLHAPMDEHSGGFIILGRLTPNKKFYFFTAFRIPLGYACYMPPYVVHCDAFLTGKYMVAYTAAHHFNTGVWRYHPSLFSGSVYAEDNPNPPEDELHCTKVHIWCEAAMSLFDLSHSRGEEPRLGGRHIAWELQMPLQNPRLHQADEDMQHKA